MCTLVISAHSRRLSERAACTTNTTSTGGKHHFFSGNEIPRQSFLRVATCVAPTTLPLSLSYEALRDRRSLTTPAGSDMPARERDPGPARAAAGTRAQLPAAASQQLVSNTSAQEGIRRRQVHALRSSCVMALVALSRLLSRLQPVVVVEEDGARERARVRRHETRSRAHCSSSWRAPTPTAEQRKAAPCS
jgi:hypothetical protein